MIKRIGAGARPIGRIAALAEAFDPYRFLAQCFGALGRGQDISLAAVGRHDAIEQAHRVGDQAGVFVIVDGHRRAQVAERVQARMIARGDGDLAQMVEGRAVFMHMAAHNHGDLAVGPHGAVGDFPVAHVAGLNAAAPMFGERRGRADHQREIDQSGIDRRAHAADERHGTGAAGGAAEQEARRDAENLADFFGPERLRIGGRNRHAEPLSLKILEAQARVFQREMHGPG